MINMRERIGKEYIAGESRSVLMVRYELPWWQICKICDGLTQVEKAKDLTTLQIDVLLHGWRAIQ